MVLAGLPRLLLLVGSAAGIQDPIRDNSFLLEEAYNQEAGVVQEISTFVRASGGCDCVYTLTQGWPLGGMRHQLSYTLPLEHHADFATTGLGDVLLNYRYQVVGTPESRLLAALRLSAILPTGSARLGRGRGGLGFQANAPVTFLPTSWLATHWNAGFTVVPSAESPAGDRATAGAINLGGSAICLARPRINLLVEAVWLWSEEVAGPGRRLGRSVTLVNPGVRWGVDLRGGLQIVTGIAYTIALGGGEADALFAYLSFEHAFRRLEE